MTLKRETSKPIQVVASNILLALSLAICIAVSVSCGVSCNIIINEITRVNEKNLLDAVVKTTFLATRLFSHISAVVLTFLALTKAGEKGRFLKKLTEFHFKIKAKQEHFSSQIYHFVLVLMSAKLMYSVLNVKTDFGKIYDFHSDIIEIFILGVVIEFSELVQVMQLCYAKIDDNTEKLLKEELSMGSVRGSSDGMYDASPDILSLCGMHTEFCYLMRQLKNGYQYQLLVIFCAVFFNFTFLPLSLNRLRITLTETTNTTTNVACFVLQLILTVNMMMLCNSIKTQVEKVKAKVVSLMANSTDANTTKYLEFFLGQLSICKMEMSVCGVFLIKPSILLSVLEVFLGYYLLLWHMWH